jgi:hypothetical protein
MIGRLSQFKWSDKQESSRDLIFIIIILGFGIMLVARLAPYYQSHPKTVVLNAIKTTSRAPKGLIEEINAPLIRLAAGNASRSNHREGWSPLGKEHHAASVTERPLFDAQTVILKTRLLSPYSSKDETTPVEAVVVGTLQRASEAEVDFTAAEGARLIGTGRANFSIKRLLLNFNEMVARDGRSYSVQGQAIDATTQIGSIDGDYSSGLGTRIAGIGLERLIMAADQVGMARLFGATVPQGQATQQFETAAMETNLEASASVSGVATQDLRETPAEITLKPGYEFEVRLKGRTSGVATP